MLQKDLSYAERFWTKVWEIMTDKVINIQCFLSMFLHS